MNVYITQERAEKMGRLLADQKGLKGVKIRTERKAVRQPDRKVDIGWTAAIVRSNRVVAFA